MNQVTYEEILSAVESKNSETLMVKGVGKKTAQKLVIDMYSKLEKYHWNPSESGTQYTEEFVIQGKEALQNLGFNNHEITAIIKQYGKEQQTEKLEVLVKFALKFINK